MLGASREAQDDSLVFRRGLEAGAFPAASRALMEAPRSRASLLEAEAEAAQLRAMTNGGALGTPSAPQAGP